MSVEEARRHVLAARGAPWAIEEAVDRLILEAQEDVILKAHAEDPELANALRRILGRGAVLVEG